MKAKSKTRYPNTLSPMLGVRVVLLPLTERGQRYWLLSKRRLCYISLTKVWYLDCLKITCMVSKCWCWAKSLSWWRFKIEKRPEKRHGIPSGIVAYNIWAVSWENQQSGCAPSEDSDQPGHPPSLIRVFAVRMKKAWVLSYPLSAQRRLWSEIWVFAGRTAILLVLSRGGSFTDWHYLNMCNTNFLQQLCWMYRVLLNQNTDENEEKWRLGTWTNLAKILME